MARSDRCTKQGWARTAGKARAEHLTAVHVCSDTPPAASPVASTSHRSQTPLDIPRVSRAARPLCTHGRAGVTPRCPAQGRRGLGRGGQLPHIRRPSPVAEGDLTSIRARTHLPVAWWRKKGAMSGRVRPRGPSSGSARAPGRRRTASRVSCDRAPRCPKDPADATAQAQAQAAAPPQCAGVPTWAAQQGQERLLVGGVGVCLDSLSTRDCPVGFLARPTLAPA